MNKFLVLVMALVVSFGAVACGGGNDKNSKSDDECGCGDEPAKTEDQVMLDKLRAAIDANDMDAVKAIWREDQYDLVDQRIGGLDEAKKKAHKFSYDFVDVEKVDDNKYTMNVQFKIVEKEGDEEDVIPQPFALIKKDDKWLFQFGHE